MKVIVIAILLVLIFINSFFYYGYYDTVLFQTKKAAKEAIATTKNNSSFRLIKIPLSEKNKFAQHEIWYEHNLYDVAKRETKNDSVYVYLYHDNAEENILSAVADFFQSDAGSFTAFPGSALLKNIYNFPDSHYFFFAEQFLFKGYSSFKNVYSQKHFAVLKTILEIITPPPKTFASQY